MGLEEGSGVADRRQVDHRLVGEMPLHHLATLVHAKNFGRKRSHGPYRLFDRKDPSLYRVLPNFPRERAVGAWVDKAILRKRYSRVGRRRHPGLRGEILDVPFRHREAAKPDSTETTLETLELKPKRHFHRRHFVQRGGFSQSLAYVCRLAMLKYDDMLRASPAANLVRAVRIVRERFEESFHAEREAGK